MSMSFIPYKYASSRTRVGTPTGGFLHIPERVSLKFPYQRAGQRKRLGISVTVTLNVTLPRRNASDSTKTTEPWPVACGVVILSRPLVLGHLLTRAQMNQGWFTGGNLNDMERYICTKHAVIVNTSENL